ncbi:YdbL family protein [Coralloluteibacterium thermophilus]|uniref:YdbL family protein n=1 Tax=Coralloluteibacterium thermophilum TaxID=2707049 RepID=A0ABV9NLX5_9GAMM
MRKLFAATLLAALALTACVTINVYFPAAEVEQAARQFVDDVMGDTPAPPPAQGPGQGGMAAAPTRSLRFDPVGFFIGTAHAQNADINLNTPAIQAIRSRMGERFRSTLAAGFDAGALGFARDGTIVVRDASAVSLRDRAALNQAVADDNRDRNALYREVAVANGHPEWESQVRETFAREWVGRARAGWWYQDAGGNWRQK